MQTITGFGNVLVGTLSNNRVREVLSGTLFLELKVFKVLRISLSPSGGVKVTLVF